MVERFEGYAGDGYSGVFYEPTEGGDWVRFTDYDALVKERDNLKAALTARAKTMLRLRDALTEVYDNLEDEVDRCYFGSTNDADQLREVWQELDSWIWDEIMADGKLPDVYEASRKAHARADAAEADRDTLAQDKAELLAERDEWRSHADNLAGIVGRWLRLFDDNGLAEEARNTLARFTTPAKEPSSEREGE